MAKHTPDDVIDVRIDKWLWAARFFKTRSLAVEAIGLGHVSCNGSRPKPSRHVRIGDELVVQRAHDEYVITVRGLSDVRGSATIAQTLYEESPENQAKREAKAAQRRAQSLGAPLPPSARPDKRARQKIRRFLGR